MWIFVVIAVIFSFLVVRRIFKKYHVKIFARFIDDLAFGYDVRMKQRKLRLFGKLQDLQDSLGRPLKIVEIGSGSGANFAYFPESSSVMCIDPEPEFDSYMDVKVTKFPNIKVTRRFGHAEDMSFIESDSIDAVVSTLVLCSVQDVDRSLKEIRRILRPNGIYLYMEHVIADKWTWTRLIQFLLDIYLWPWLIMGCNLTRSTWKNIHNAGFREVELDKFVAKELCQPTPVITGVFLLASHVVGTAVK